MSDEIENLHDLAEKIGYHVVDDEVMEWIASGNLMDDLIAMGDLDDYILSRAMDMGLVYEEDVIPEPDPLMETTLETATRIRQHLHRTIHPNGPFGWEFCGRGCANA